MKLPPKELIEQVLVRNDVDRRLMDTLLLDYDDGSIDTLIDRLINNIEDTQDEILLDQLQEVKDELDDTKADLDDVQGENFGLEDDNADLEIKLDDAKKRIKKLRKYIITKFDNDYLEGDEDE